MEHKYDHLSIEKKWQKFWDDNKTFKSYDSSKKEKYYISYHLNKIFNGLPFTNDLSF